MSSRSQSSRYSTGRVDRGNQTGDYSQSLLLSDLQQLLEGEEYSDVVLLAKGGQRMPAHSVILAARSEYFRALLHGGLSESLATCVPLQVEATALRSLLAYLYTSRPGLATLATDTLFHLLDTARMMCLTDLQARVEEHIIQTVLEPATLVQVLNLAVELKFSNIVDVCFGRINDSLERDPSLSSLSPMAISLILKDQQIEATKDSLLVHIVHSLLSSWLQLYEWQGLEEQEEFLTKVQQVLDPDFLERMSQVGLGVLLEMATGVEGRQASTQGSGLESGFWVDGGKCVSYYVKELKKRVKEALVMKERRKQFISRKFSTLVLK